ncbi:MAG TPA: reverse transcriptase/maturase family protein [Xanthomonadaceae bacterium]|nr:reverse transcriptase/maturase family protein [Xanthomonadaceae bacterium]
MSRQPLLERALRPANIDAAWRHLNGDSAPWAPGMPRRQMEQNRLRHLLELVDEARAGRYRPCGMRHFTLRKADGSERVLSALYLRDKLLQRAVAQVLDAEGERRFHHDSYGYRRGRGVPQALERCAERIRCGLRWLVDADIRAFFDRIPHTPLLRLVRNELRDPGITQLAAAWLDAGTYGTGILGRRRGIPQGAVVSPFLCNLYLHQLDQAWTREGIPFVRYADDFLLFLPDQRTAERALAFTRSRLGRLDLDLHPEKTRVVQASRNVVFLGEPLRVPKRCVVGQTSSASPAAPTRLRKWLNPGRLFS